MIGGARIFESRLDVQTFNVAHELRLVFARHRERVDVFAFGRRFHFIFANVGVAQHVADIGDVHDLFYLVPVVFQSST